jgi:hypothetical protein
MFSKACDFAKHSPTALIQCCCAASELQENLGSPYQITKGAWHRHTIHTIVSGFRDQITKVPGTGIPTGVLQMGNSGCCAWIHFS